MAYDAAPQDYGPRTCPHARAQNDTAQRGLRMMLDILDADVAPNSDTAILPLCAEDDARMIRESLLELLESFEEARR